MPRARLVGGNLVTGRVFIIEEMTEFRDWIDLQTLRLVSLMGLPGLGTIGALDVPGGGTGAARPPEADATTEAVPGLLGLLGRRPSTRRSE